MRGSLKRNAYWFTLVFVTVIFGSIAFAMAKKGTQDTERTRNPSKTGLFGERFGQAWRPPSSIASPKDLARFAREWVPYADWVGIGTVKEVQSHPEGPYHTWIILDVEKCIKGDPDKKEIVIKLITGSVERGKLGERATGVGITTESSFGVGERTLVLLTTVPNRLHVYYERVQKRVGTGLIPTHPHPEYKKVKECVGYFETISKYLKFEIVGNKVRFGSNPLASKRTIVSEGAEIGDLNDFVEGLQSAVLKHKGNDSNQESGL